MNKDQRPKSEDPHQIDWRKVRRVLVVRLRSIGDTVLATPSLIALKRFLPDARIDILLEDWVAPVLDGFDSVDEILIVGNSTTERMKTARELRRRKYDVVFNLHGGSTSTFLTFASGARHRVGYQDYRNSFLLNHKLSSSSDFWKREKTHSAEQQLALLGFVDVPVDDRPRSRLVATAGAVEKMEMNLHIYGVDEDDIALIHPSTAFFTKQWPARNFAKIAEFLTEQGLRVVAVTSSAEKQTLDDLANESKVPITTFDDISLPEIIALASRAKLFVGNDSGIAHIAAAVNTPTVVIFGSSNRNHWYPWTDASNEIVFEEFACQPCPGYECKEFGEPRCILSISTESVLESVERILGELGLPKITGQ